MTLPESLTLTASQRQAIENHIGALRELAGMTPENDPCHGGVTMTAVSKMLMTLAGAKMGDLAMEAKGDAYMAALEDVPNWAVEEAIRKWYRGAYGDQHDYKWPPAPATLRELGRVEEFAISRGVANRLSDLLAAEPLQEFDADHRSKMQEKLKALGIPGVGKE